MCIESPGVVKQPKIYSPFLLLSPRFLQVVWPALEDEFGWTKVYGPRMHDVYYLPMGVARGQNGARCRVDYYDSNRQARVKGWPAISVVHSKEHRYGHVGLLVHQRLVARAHVTLDDAPDVVCRTRRRLGVVV